MPPELSDGRLARGVRTRTAILDAAVVLASEQGLHGLSLGHLAEQLGVSKSGLFAHWRSKEELQLATIARAREQWVEEIVSPALAAPRGVRRLWALHERRLAFYQARVLPGDCFFALSEFEYGVRPGPVREALVASLTDWLELVRRLVTEAITAGDLPDTVDPALLAFEIDAMGVAGVMQARLLDRVAVHHHARAAVLNRLRALCPHPDLLPEA